MSSSEVARLAGVTERAAQCWDKKREPPKEVAVLMLRRWAEYAKRVAEVRERMRATIDEHGDPEVVNLTRFIDDEQATRAGESLTARQHGALLGHVLMALTLEGVLADVDYCPSEE